MLRRSAVSIAPVASYRVQSKYTLSAENSRSAIPTGTVKKCLIRKVQIRTDDHAYIISPYDSTRCAILCGTPSDQSDPIRDSGAVQPCNSVGIS
jgi:hypothetical protein